MGRLEPLGAPFRAISWPPRWVVVGTAVVVALIAGIGIGGESAVYIVGKDMQPGLYHTQGSPGGSNCYYATLNSTSTSDIADNNDFTGPETVQVNSCAFETDGPCTWVKVG